MRPALAWSLALAAACAANEPAALEFDSSAGLIVVDVAGDGFVRQDGRRVPWEAAVLSLRQRTRALGDDERMRLVVHLRADAQAADSEAASLQQRVMDRLVDELFVMGVRQVKFL